MKYDKQGIVNRILKERENIKLSQKKLAEKMDKISPLRNGEVRGEGIIGRWESGNTPIPLEEIFVLCEALSCDLGYLLGDPKYDCKTIELTEIQAATGLSESAIEQLMLLRKRSFRKGSYDHNDLLSEIIEHPDFILLIAEISSYVKNFKPNQQQHFCKEHEKIPEIIDEIAGFFNCEEHQITEYVKKASEAAITSYIMNIVNHLAETYGVPVIKKRHRNPPELPEYKET